MKAFMEEYGLIAVVAIVVLILAAAASTIGNGIADAIQDVVDDFTAKIAELGQRPAVPGA